MLRITTSGVLQSYKFNLNTSYTNLYKAQNTVLTQRNFNSYAEDPTTASEAFTLRRSFLRTSIQIENSQTVISQYESAWSSIDSLVSLVANESGNSAWAAVMEGKSETSGSGRNALGMNLIQMADSMALAMNVKYGDSYVFAGADGLNAPFTWDDDGNLCYRNIPVDADGNTAALKDLIDNEARHVDVGLGLQGRYTDIGGIVETTALNSALHGIEFLGYGKDTVEIEVDGGGTETWDVPNNIISIIKRMGVLLSDPQHCSADGEWVTDDAKNEFAALFEKFGEASDALSNAHVKLDADSSFLKRNLSQLETNAFTLNEQIVELEQVDLAEAITSFSWAQYCYNAALKVGNSILSESLMDYMQ